LGHRADFLSLLDKGHTPLIRNTAAQQLAEVQKQHPDELFNLLTRIVPFLRSGNWDTRSAAAKAIGGIVDNAPRYDPNEDGSGINEDAESEELNGNGVEAEDPLADDILQLETLDVAAILQNGNPLLGSAGKEYDYKFIGMDPSQRLAHQKASLSARLGLSGKYIDVDFVSQKDFEGASQAVPQGPPQGSIVVPTPRIDTSVARHSNVASPVTGVSPTEETPVDGSGISQRQLNALKRKKKKELKNQVNKVRVIDFSERKSSVSDYPTTPASARPVAVKTEAKEEDNENSVGDYFSLDRKGGDDDSKVVSEFKGLAVPIKSELQTEEEDEGKEWPFERLCELLIVDLFDHTWETRHGAAMGIREVIRAHGAGAGRVMGKSRQQNDELNRRWLDDLACRLCCVFMLDRFGDYVSDNVVVPVRESSGQALAAVLKHLPAVSVNATFNVLRQLVTQDSKESDRAWQPCHGGMIGMRYLVSTRDDLLGKEPELLDGVLACVMKCLGDPDDDVRAVSAATLIPIAKDIVSDRPNVLNDLIQIVWNCLSDLSDDLSASTGYVMDLLAKLCSFPEVLEAMKLNAAADEELSFDNLVPRLFPFLRHTITSVRSAVLRALLTFLDIKGDSTTGWIDTKALRLIYQNILLERDDKVLKLSLQVWRSIVDALISRGPETFADQFSPNIDPIVTLTLHPVGVSRYPIPYDVTLFIRPSGQTFTPSLSSARKISPANGSEPAKKRRKSDKKEKDPQPIAPVTHNIDAHMMAGDVDLIGMDVIIRNKLAAAVALGKAIAAYNDPSKKSVFGTKIIPQLKSPFASTQMIAAIVVEEHAKNISGLDALAQSFSAALRPIVEEERPPCYSDLTSYLHIVRAQCQALLNTFRDQAHVSSSKLPMIAALVQGDENASEFAFSVADAEKIVGPDFERLRKGLTPAQRVQAIKALTDAKADAEASIEEAKTAKDQRDVRIKAAAAAAIVTLRDIPKKQALVIKAMMDSVKTEENFDLQKRSAAAVAVLVETMVKAGKKVVADKVVGNLVKFYCTETAETPEFHANVALIDGILSLKKEEDIRDHPDAAKFEREARAARIMRRGSKETLEQLVSNFGAELFDKLPSLRAVIEQPIRQAFSDEDLPADLAEPENTLGQAVVDGLSTLRALVPKFDSALHPFIAELLPTIIKALRCKLGVLRYAAAKCFATICSVMTVDGITMLVEKVLPSISNPLEVHCRQGIIECIYHLIHVMDDGILPYVVFLIVPVLGRMSDSDSDVRLIATTTFATLVKLVPLEAGIPDPPGLSKELLTGREKERKFIAQMLDPKKVEDFVMPVSVNAELRPYQQEGVNWLAFLNRYNLHGILCDDMGLGKTLQTLCMVASDHHMRAEDYEKTKNPEVRPLPTLIVCPPSLSGHWQQEIRTYAPFLTSIAYVGPTANRQALRDSLTSTDIVITSYDVCRNDVSILGPLNWNYIVLDEGHLIKNPKTKTTIAVKTLKSYHRLILSGTPIQNNVLELWSLFDFLMPGFLGTEKVFQDRFARPIAASRGAKANSKEQESGALAIEALHKQVLPFLLRRLKEEVLNDLPPKILQNYYCDLSDLQRKLFEDFTKKQSKAIHEAANEKSREAKQHIFQALQYMRKLCNSPALVIKESHKQYEAISRQLATQGTSLRDITHAPKLTALRDLLVDCGIGASDVTDNSQAALVSGEVEAVSQHRALIFCQMKEMLDMVQTEVLQKFLPSVQFLRLDGSVEASKRQAIVNNFNSDPSYDVLLLTTSVGGLGLNLTGADTVIFVEHDWNPQKDMQAMDRAHRIGQKKVVNVYRIVTRGTLEEKILR
jgi:TATA-binding protein-associated factor